MQFHQDMHSRVVLVFSVLVISGVLRENENRFRCIKLDRLKPSMDVLNRKAKWLRSSGHESISDWPRGTVIQVLSLGCVSIFTLFQVFQPLPAECAAEGKDCLRTKHSMMHASLGQDSLDLRNQSCLFRLARKIVYERKYCLGSTYCRD